MSHITPAGVRRRLRGETMKTLPTVACVLSLALGAVAVRAAEPGWIADSKSGCKIYNAVPRPNESISWDGPCVNGIAQGHGTLQWIENRRNGEREEGDFVDGKMNGHGVSMWPNGSRYEGDFVDSRFSGHGIWTWSNGNRYEGDFVDGKFGGHGKVYCDHGRRYEGYWRQLEKGQMLYCFARSQALPANIQ
jgi:hypothetical protein